MDCINYLLPELIDIVADYALMDIEKVLLHRQGHIKFKNYTSIDEKELYDRYRDRLVQEALTGSISFMEELKYLNLEELSYIRDEYKITGPIMYAPKRPIIIVPHLNGVIDFIKTYPSLYVSGSTHGLQVKNGVDIMYAVRSPDVSIIILDQEIYNMWNEFRLNFYRKNGKTISKPKDIYESKNENEYVGKLFAHYRKLKPSWFWG